MGTILKPADRYLGPMAAVALPRSFMQPSTYSAEYDTYAAATGTRHVLDFDGSAADESGAWQFQMPSWYDGSGLVVEAWVSMDGTDADPIRILIDISNNTDDTEVVS